jgi:hypothetical protein
MKQDRTHPARGLRKKHVSPSQIIASGVLGLLLIPVIMMNATPGHFGYLDTDGCACFVTYTMHQPLAICEKLRPQQCDFRFDQLLVFLSYLDFNK